MKRGTLKAGTLAGTAMALILSSAALAQDAGSSTVLDEISVEGISDPNAPFDGYLAPSTLSGSKTATPLLEIPQSVSVIGRDELNDQGVQKTDEALRYTAGVFTQPFGYDSDTNWMFIRGFQATASGTYLDGLQNFGYAFGSFYVDSFNLERIEVLKGAASVLYGGSNPGGIINYVSKRPTGERLRYVESGINDAGTAYLGFDIGDRIKDAFDFRVSGRIQGGNGYTDFEEGIRGSISPSLTLHLNDATKLTILANYTGTDETHNGGAFLPYVGTVVDASFGKIDPERNFTEPDLDSYTRTQASIGYEFEHAFNKDWTFRQNVRFGAADIDEQFLYGNGYSTEPMLSRINFAHETSVKTFVADTQIEGVINTGPVEHTLLAGVDYKYFNIDQVQSSALWGTKTDINVVNPVYGTAQTTPVSYLNQDLTQNQLGFYMQDQLRFSEGWIVTLNGRHDSVWTSTHDRPTYYAPSQDTRNDSYESAFSGRAGLAYEFDNGLTPYVSAATFFNPQIGTTRLGKMFSPETGTQYEVGLKYAPTFMDALFTVALFDLTRQNVLTVDPVNINYQVQTGEVRSRGIELEAKGKVTDNLTATAAFTAYDLEITKDNDATIVGKTPYIVPEVQGSLWLDYAFDEEFVKGLSIGGGLRYLGQSWADQQNLYKVPETLLVDARIGYKRDNWGVDLNVSNLFDETYVSACQTTSSCAYGEGRAIRLKVHATW